MPEAIVPEPATPTEDTVRPVTASAPAFGVRASGTTVRLPGAS